MQLVICPYCQAAIPGDAFAPDAAMEAQVRGNLPASGVYRTPAVATALRRVFGAVLSGACILGLIALFDGGSQSGDSEGEKTVRTFIDTWVSAGGNAASAIMDGRSPASMREVPGATMLTKFDGEVHATGEGSWSIFATGEQVPTFEFTVVPVAKFADVYMPVTIQIAVAKDSGKVLAVKPDL